MKKSVALTAGVALASILSFAQAPAGQGRGAPPGQPGQGRGGANAVPGRGSASVRWEPWSAMRTGVSTVLGWQVGIAAETLHDLTFFNAVEKVDLLGLANIEGSSIQK